jgi:hypothetical protein
LLELSGSMKINSAESTAFAVLLSLAVVGCGGNKAPQAQPKLDSSSSFTAAAAAPVSPGPRTTHGGAAVDAAPTAPAHDTVPTIVAKTFPKAALVQYRSRPFPHRVIRDSAELVLGYEVFSDSAGVTARGYAGLVPVQVFFDKRGRPVRIYILDNSETPAYMDLVYRAGLLDTLLMFDPGKPDTVDAVTLATTSSHAVIAGVTGLAARVAAEIAAKPEGVR